MNNVKKEFAFKEYDLEGMETLKAIAVAPQFNEWMYQTISKNLKGRVLEVGSGIGNISEFFLRDKRYICLSDIRDNYCSYLQDQFEGEDTLRGIFKLDLVHPDFDRAYAEYLGSFDSLFALNVIEHIEDDRLAIANCKKLLKKGGRMLILVPAYQALYNSFDKAVEHYRRYNRKNLTQLFLDNDLRVQHSQYFNFPGLFGWYISGSLMKKELIPTGQMKFYNSLVPIFKIVDKMVMNKMGLSVLVEAEKI